MMGWILSLRLKPLIVGAGPVLLGLALAHFIQPQSTWNWPLNGLILFCVICIQIATHFFNDALDFIKGADGPERQGPQRAVQKALISPSQLIRAGFICLTLAGLTGLYLMWHGGWPVFCVGIVSLFMAYLYTGGPWPLAYTGLADSFVLVFFGLMPVSVVFYLNTGYFSPWTLIPGLQVGLLALSLLVVNNLRDEGTDKKARKKTLVVRFGPYFGAWEWTLAHYFSYLIGAFWFLKAGSAVGLIVFTPFVLLPLSFYNHRLLQKALKAGQNGKAKPLRSAEPLPIWGGNTHLYSRLLSLTCLHYLLFVCLLTFWFIQRA